MSSRVEIYNKIYSSDIFNTNPNYAKVEAPKGIARNHHTTLESTKEEVFNVGKERRIRRNKPLKDIENNNVLSRSTAKRKNNNYDKIYGSDIFNQRTATSTERRRGPNKTSNLRNKTTFVPEGNNEEYKRDLKYYTKQHRAEKKEYDPDKYMSKITPQERYYREHYGAQCPFGSNQNTNYENVNENKNEERKINNYIHNKINLNNEIKEYNNARADQKGKPGEENYNEKRYFKQKPRGIYEGRRNFVDSNEFSQNNCKINKQIQMESHIFNNDNQNKDFNEEVKEINDRLETEKKRTYNTNVLGLPYKEVKVEQTNNDKNFYGSVNSRWKRTNLDWKDPEAQIMFANADENRNISARQRKINQMANSQNIDIFSGEEKKPINFDQEQPEPESKKIDEILESIPNLDEGQKLGIKMKASVMDCNNDDDWNNRGKLYNDFYRNNPGKINKKQEVTGKINDRRDAMNNDYNNNDNIYQDYVITYSTKGNQFERFDENDIQRLLSTKGIQAYDIQKNPFDKGNYNMINLKIKGRDKNDIYNKMKKVENEFKKQNYKINIEKGSDQNYGKKQGKTYQPSKYGIRYDNSNDNEGKYKMMSNDMKGRKGFTKEFDQVNYGYKRSKIV